MDNHDPKTTSPRRPLSLSRETVLAIRTSVRAGARNDGSGTSRAWCPSCCSTRVSSC